jgi:hypothetical protein
MLAVWDLLLAALSLLIALGWVAMLVDSRRNVSLVPSLGRSEGTEDCLTVSVIVPARNEAEVLPATLESLLIQRGLRKEVILVDDHSTDGTERTASLYLDRGVVYVRPPRTPEGWMGKSWASDLLSALKGEGPLRADHGFAVYRLHPHHLTAGGSYPPRSVRPAVDRGLGLQPITPIPHQELPSSPRYLGLGDM